MNYEIMKRGRGYSIDKYECGHWTFEAQFPTLREAKEYVIKNTGKDGRKISIGWYI